MYKIPTKLKKLYIHLDILYYLSDYRYIAQLYRYTSYSYACLYDKLQFLEDEKLIESQKIGRKRIYTFTKRGEIIKDNLLQLNEVFLNTREK